MALRETQYIEYSLQKGRSSAGVTSTLRSCSLVKGKHYRTPDVPLNPMHLIQADEKCKAERTLKSQSLSRATNCLRKEQHKDARQTLGTMETTIQLESKPTVPPKPRHIAPRSPTPDSSQTMDQSTEDEEVLVNKSKSNLDSDSSDYQPIVRLPNPTDAVQTRGFGGGLYNVLNEPVN